MHKNALNTLARWASDGARFNIEWFNTFPLWTIKMCFVTVSPLCRSTKLLDFIRDPIYKENTKQSRTKRVRSVRRIVRTELSAAGRLRSPAENSRMGRGSIAIIEQEPRETGAFPLGDINGKASAACRRFSFAYTLRNRDHEEAFTQPE
jgi:hypothetical protein